MLKKVLSLCLVLCMAVSFMIPGYAKSSGKKISADTVITRDNVYDVLAYLGLDSSELKLSDNTKSKVAPSNVTVGDLQEAIAKAKSQSPEPISERYYAAETPTITTRGLVINKTLYHDSVYSTYTITQSCTGTFELGVPGWKSCSGGSATVGSEAMVVDFKENPKITTNVTADKTKIVMSWSAIVVAYYGIGDVGVIPINTYTHSGTCNWLASEFANT